MKQVPNSVLALDVGSRTLLWVVGKRRGEMLLWGEAGMATMGLGRLLQEPQLKGAILKQGGDKLKELGRRYAREVERKVGVLTGALRELPEVAAEVIEAGVESGIDLQVISAREEGRLAWLGSSDLFPNGVGAVLDLGGHTAQLYWARTGRFKLVGSLPIGCQTLTARFFYHDPILPAELINLNQFLVDALQKSAWKLPADLMLALAGGTASAWAGFSIGANFYQPEQLHGLKLLVSDGENLAARLAPLTQEEIGCLLPFDAERAPVFLAGLCACLAVLKHLGRAMVIHTEKSVRHGVAMQVLGLMGI